MQTTLFARRTLRTSKFYELMHTRPICVRHLVHFLETRCEFSALTDLLTALGQYEQAALIHYKQAAKTPNLEARIKRVKDTLNNHFYNHPDKTILIEHLHLLERISPIAAADQSNASIRDDPNGPKLDVVNPTVLKTLLYCCYHHYGAGENLLHSPIAIRKIHKLTDRQFTWIAVLARARRKSWRDCESLVVTKGWLGGKKAKGSVSADRIVRTLHSAGAPSDVLQVYLPLVEDAEVRLELAVKFGVHSVVIDEYVAQKDRQALERYKAKLEPQSNGWFYAENALSVSNTRWKN